MLRTLPDVLAILRAHQQELRDMGVAHAAVFGSVARGQAGPSSDVDVLVDLDYGKDLGIFEYARIKLYIDGLPGGRTVYAVTRALEIISEASRRRPEQYKRGHPEIDWPAIAAAGNVYRHEYEAVDEAVLWKTRPGLAGLQAAIAEELNRQ